MDAKASVPQRYCGRLFSAQEMDLVRGLITSDPAKTRAQLSRDVCDLLDWRRPDGRRKDMSCRVAMLRMERDGLVQLPPPRKGNGNGHRRPRLTPASEPQEPLTAPVGRLGELVFRGVETPQDSGLWNELIERHHYLGYQPLPGAQVRYLIARGDQLLAAVGFGAAAWTVAPRDRFIGWTREQRRNHLPLVVNNARFLILPWIHSPNLASHLLARLARRLPEDWERRYSYRPVLLETFVEQQRFRGTCYRAANWIPVGQTQGRGKLDRYKRFAVPVKDVFLLPLDRDFRQRLCAPQ
ncbi:MAG: DUF4338 domain-containing protein [Candidatus Binatia bacterium]